MIPYFVRLLDIKINNAAIPNDWKKAVVVPIYIVLTDRWSQITDLTV
jgi:hypothetical protein